MDESRDLAFAGEKTLRKHPRRGDVLDMAASVYYTANMVRALPDDGNRYEAVHGELLVTPAPRAWHQEVIGRLCHALRSYLIEHPCGHLFLSPADISWSDDTLVQPDLFVVDLDEARTMDWADMKDLRLVVEVSSPSTARYDRFTKRRLYQEMNIPAYWIVDLEKQLIEVWTPGLKFPKVEDKRVAWLPEGAAEPFIVDLQQLFLPL